MTADTQGCGAVSAAHEKQNMLVHCIHWKEKLKWKY